MKKHIKPEEVKEVWEYREGNLYWRENPHPIRKFDLSKPAGCINSIGYRVINYKRVLYPAHRLIFAYHKGYFPKEVGHKNGIPSDNRIENLEDVTHSQNMMNQGCMNVLGFKHIYKQKNKKNYKQGFIYVFGLRINGKMKRIKASTDLCKLLVFRNSWLQKHDRLRWQAIMRFEYGQLDYVA